MGGANRRAIAGAGGWRWHGDGGAGAGGVGVSGFLGGGIGPVALSTWRRAGNGLLNNLIAYWPLNEAGGANNALDLHSNALTLTQVASPGSAAGKVYAGARTFNGSTQYFSRVSEAALQTGDVDFTLAAWVYLTFVPAGAGYQIIQHVINSPTNSSGEFGIAYGGNATDSLRRLQFFVSANGAIWTDSIKCDAFGAFAINTWYLILAQHDAANNTISVSVNGQTSSKAYTAGVYAGSNTWWFGGISNGSWLNGRIGPVAMWKSAAGGGGVLTAAQRTALWNGGAGLAYADFTL
jgi:hypothetical protein